VIGRRSFGKGLVQEQFNFGDGSALNLTIARYFTPLGRSIQRPYKMGAQEYFNEASKRLQKSELNADGRLNDSLYDKNRAFKTSAGHVLYGGGGIMPDVYVPVDTSSFNAFYYALRSRGVLTAYLFNHVVHHYHPSSLGQLLNEFNLSTNEYRKLVDMAAKQGIKASPGMRGIARAAVNTEIKALLAKFYFDDQAYYKVLNAYDSAISKSIQQLR
jgi:carboxyl-terminal processing protease